MNKSMLMGLVGGIAIATAGGVAGYAFLSQPAAVTASGSAAIDEPVAEQESAVAAQAATPVPSAATASTARQPAPAPARQAATAPVRQTAPAPQPVAAAAPPAPQERCWDEEVTVQADPKDDKAIAGTAAGAVIGGAIAKRLGDDNDLLTAAGAAAGAFAGRRAQRQVQENKTTTVTERRCEPL
jgi:uncharacterized protein YcfJ